MKKLMKKHFYCLPTLPLPSLFTRVPTNACHPVILTLQAGSSSSLPQMYKATRELLLFMDLAMAHKP